MLASLTYFKAEPGDEVTIVVPEGDDSDWAAVENVIKKVDGGVPDEDAPLMEPDDLDKDLELDDS